MSIITDHLANYLNELDSYMKRLERDGLSKSDRKLFLDLNNEYYDVFRQAEEFPKEILQGMAEFGDNIINQTESSKELAGRYRDEIVQHANAYIDTLLRNELQFGIFQKDAEISNLQQEKIGMLQKLVELDMRMYAEITEQTKEILEVENCEILNGKVRERALWEQPVSVSESAKYQEEAVRQDMTELSKDELDQILDKHFRERGSGRGTKVLDLSNCIISNYVFKGELTDISFDRSDLRYCEFRMTKAEHLDFQNAALSDCKMIQGEFDKCNFRDADINASIFRNSMFRDCSFDTAYLRQSSINDSVFYKTSFEDTRVCDFMGSENIFHECGHPEDTVRMETVSMEPEESADYVNRLREMFSNEGYGYSWELDGVDLKDYAANLSVKISLGGEVVEEEKYSALLDNDTYAILHIDSGRQGDSLIRMFMPEMNEAIMEKLQERSREQENQRVRLKFPYMTRGTFLAVKDEIKRMGAEFDSEHKAWYVNQSAGEEKINSIQEYIAAHDEAIYLHLPPAGQKEFRSMTDQLKQDGARYNPDKKSWFITEKADRSKFQQYIPKDSVYEKLNGYKAEAEKQKDNHQIGDRKKETPELA